MIAVDPFLRETLAKARHPKTQAQLAKALGVTQTAVSAWERGKRWPSRPVLERLLDELGISGGLRARFLEAR